ncbi:DNA-binding response regulator [Spongiactinospora gelatinilytica]|uniref:DNA-binding response regulator n=1 Tax=Spongiactinospora gelatinilytica TaxID=2666298 RepID=A0A2W2HNZ4_9ACTN|nr:response regulator transcription factor [Spongiactinospora gelatinilytica]PZG53345.1 DNA-binding response regulator [Spongiactinospora gelatinilytica]
MDATDSSGGIGVLLGVDHVIFRECLRDWIGGAHGIAVVGEARSSAEVPHVAARLRPDVVLLSTGGDRPAAELRVLREVRRRLPRTKIVVLSLRNASPVEEALEHGTHWCLRSTSTRADLVLALRNVAARNVAAHTEGPSPSHFPPLRQVDGGDGPRWRACLSTREQEVLDLVSQALSNAQIGARLSITEGTVKRHLRNIYAKLGAVSRIDAINKAAYASPTWNSPHDAAGTQHAPAPGSGGDGQRPISQQHLTVQALDRR